jgi:predicted  nucleic acid-binding Zn-ribbon protein
MRTSMTCAALLALGTLLITPIGARQIEERSRTQGLKETDQFVKSGGETLDAVTNAKLQIRKTLDAYNTLVSRPSKNMKSDYKKLMKSVDSMNDRLTEARQKIDQMQQTADIYFAGRGDTVKNIHNPELQDRARQRLTDSQKEFSSVRQSLRSAGEALEPFRKQLVDQITYLGSDLNPSAMTSLKPDAEKLNAHGQKLFDQTDTAVATAHTYFQGLRSAES